MKYIQIPADAEIYNLNGERMKDDANHDAVVTFEQFVLARIGDPKFAADMKGVISAVQIKDQLNKKNCILALENADWSLLKDVTEKPSGQTAYHPAVAHNLLPFMKAITEATDKEPPPVDETEGAS